MAGIKPSPRPAEDDSPRKREILQVAAQLFGRKGYRGTSMREIGEHAGVLGGSLYHHVKSKDALFVELTRGALNAAGERIALAVARHDDPWERLEAACVTLLEIELEPDSITLPLMNDFRAVPEPVRREIVACRDTFELQFRNLVDALPLPPAIDRSVYRNLLLNLLNGTGEWYRTGRMTPADIGHQIALIFRHIS